MVKIAGGGVGNVEQVYVVDVVVDLMFEEGSSEGVSGGEGASTKS